MANSWFRMYSEFCSDPKVQSMSEAMQRRLVMLFCLRSCNVLVTLRDEEIAFALRLTEAELAETKSLFMAKGFVDQAWNLRNWDKRQFASDSSKERTRAWRERHKNKPVTAEKRHSDALDTDTDTDTEQTHTKKPIVRAPHAADLNGRTSSRFQDFWEKYPMKVGRDAAARQFMSLVMVENEEMVFSCLARYLASDQVARGIVSKPDNWLYYQHKDGWKAEWPGVVKVPANREHAGVTALKNYGNGDKS